MSHTNRSSEIALSQGPSSPACTPNSSQFPPRRNKFFKKMDEEEDHAPKDTSEAAAKRKALRETLQQRREQVRRNYGDRLILLNADFLIFFYLANILQVLSARERNYESRRENSLLVARILEELEKGEEELGGALDGATECMERGVGLTDYLDGLASKLQAAEKRLSEQASVLPQYDLRARQNALGTLRERFRQVQDDLQPKKRFGFKGTKKKENVGARKREQEEADSNGQNTNKSASVDIGCLVKDRRDETVELHGETVSGRDVLASDLVGCEVRVRGSANTLHLARLSGCTVLSGPVATSVFVDDCSNCTFVVACQQLRAHRTVDSEFLLHVTSGAIVEDCRGVRFAAHYALDYSGLDGDYAASGLNRSVNRAGAVQDFNWLASDKQSPNWTLIEEKRETFNM